MATDHKALAAGILAGVGGQGNIASAGHCATRLRLKLRDAEAADKAAVEALPGVVTVREAGGQFQVVIGNVVPEVHRELSALINASSQAPAVADEKNAQSSGNLLNRFIDLVSGIIHPILWTLAGAGLFKAIVTMTIRFKWLSEGDSTYIILNAASDSIFYFLPIALSITAAQHFRTNQYTSMAIAAALVYPSIVQWATDGVESVDFLGLPVIVANYTSSLIPIIIAVWIQGYLERFLARVLPSTIKNFTIPLIVLIVMAPLVLLTVGPVTTYAANGISSGVERLFVVAPWAAGAIMGGLWQVFVLFGLHWALVPIMLNDLETLKYTLMGGPILPAVLAQGAATLAVMLRTRSRKLKQVAGPAALSGLLAGITEPAIYGVNLPKKRPFLFGCIGGAVGGILAAIGGNANDTFVFPSFIAMPAYMNVGSFAMQLIGCAVAMAIAFSLTMIVGFADAPDDVDADAQRGDEPGGASANASGSQAENPGSRGQSSTGGAEAEPRSRGASPSGSPAEMAGTGPTSPEAAPAAAASVGSASADGTVVAAPVSGRMIALADVPDKVFASGALGQGIAIVPSSGRICAPVDGNVDVAMDTGHAYGMTSANGAEILVHIGIDTVQLDGRHFTKHVEVGQRVAAGDLLAEVDLAAIEEAGYDTTTILVVTNSDAMSAVTPEPVGTISAGAPALTITA